MSNKEKNSRPLLEWQSFPVLENIRRTIFLLVFLVFFFVALWFVTVISWEMPLFYIVGIVFLTATLLPYFIPTKYQLFEHKIVVTYLFIKVERIYSDFRCYYTDKKGVMLGTFMMPRWLDGFRGQSLRFSQSRDEEEKLITILEEKIGNRR